MLQEMWSHRLQVSVLQGRGFKINSVRAAEDVVVTAASACAAVDIVAMAESVCAAGDVVAAGHKCL